MVTVSEQYEAFPYPARDPAEEKSRLVTGSPSNPVEMDHFLWGGQRDWSKRLRVLVAGGGTGDGLIQLAQLMTDARRPYDITYVDLSRASREVAEARAKVRGLKNIRFLTGSLLDAPDLGQFDYIDCCGVLHHLPDPAAGFAALRAACAPGGGLGFMVYAPLGRSGVYPLQRAFGAMFDGLPPKDRLAAARKVFAALPDAHPFKRNPNLGDHKSSDAGFYDLLLHGQDRAYSVPDLLEELAGAGWALSDFASPGQYDPSRFGPVPDAMDRPARMALAEDLSGTLKVHVGYAVPTDDPRQPAGGAAPDLIPHLKGGPPQALAGAVAQGRPIPIKSGQETITLSLPPEAAPLIARVDGRSSVGTITKAAGLTTDAARPLWLALEQALSPWGLYQYSALLKGRVR